MVISWKAYLHEHRSQIVRGRRVYADWEPAIKGAPGDEPMFYCRVVGGPRRLQGIMITDRSGLPPRSPEAFAWATGQAIETAMSRESAS